MPPTEIRVDDVISDPDSGCWIIVSRIVSGAISAKQHRGCAEDEVNQHFSSFYGDESLNEVITAYGERVRSSCAPLAETAADDIPFEASPGRSTLRSARVVSPLAKCR